MRAALSLPFVLVLVGCGSGEAGSAAKAESDASAPVALATGAGKAAQGEAGEARLASFETPVVPRLIVRNAELTLRVEAISAAEKRVGEVARREGGTVEASQGSDLAGPAPTLSLTLRVPEGRFDASIAELEALGVRLGKTIASEDVTAQAVDLEARLKSLRVQEEAYRAILGAARKISDVLEVQERLTGVRTQIEEIVAQRRTLGDHAARSKILVSLTQALRPEGPAPESDWMAQTWGDATGSLRATGRAMAALGLWLVAMLPVWLPLVLVGSWAWRRTRRNAL